MSAKPDQAHFVIWPRKGIAHTVLKGDEQRWLGDFDTVEEAEEWGYRLFGKLFFNVPLLSGHDIQVMRQVPGRC